MSHYCYDCGTSLGSHMIEGRLREVCPACGKVHYQQLKVGAGCAIISEDGLLLVQRAIEPWRGTWYLPAGYSEVDETPNATAERETREETGLIVTTSELVGVFLYDTDPRGNGILVLYKADVINGIIAPGPEALAASYFSPLKVRQLSIASAHWEAVQKCLELMEYGTRH